METYSFNKRDAEKIVEVIDGGSFTREPRISDPWPDDGPHAAIVYLTTSVTARSGTTLGSGTGKLQKVSASVLSDYTEADGSTTYSFTVYNLTGKTIASGNYIGVKREYATGAWIVDPYYLFDCNPVSDVYIDSGYLKQAFCDGTIENIVQLTTSCP